MIDTRVQVMYPSLEEYHLFQLQVLGNIGHSVY
jgi:hypothetical protein